VFETSSGVNIKNRELLIINYAMDQFHPLLAHQFQAVYSLAGRFDHVTVITGVQRGTFPADNVTIVNAEWIAGRRISSSFRFLRLALKTIKGRRPSVVFSHMTEVQSFLLSPFTRLLGIKHYLWYAHAHRSVYLKICEFMLDGIVSSTQGSCPVRRSEKFLIGQAIDTRDFKFKSKGDLGLNNLVHLGRFDPSKDIAGILKTVESLQRHFPEIQFTQIGNPTTETAKEYANSLKIAYSNRFLFLESVSRSEIPKVLTNYDCFIHAYVGSLDKSLVEATMLGLPVITLNKEYQKIFGTWSDLLDASLYDEYVAVSNLRLDDLRQELIFRRKIAEKDHSLDNWVDKLANILQS
jgi:glycosyltransferase involved in cell wall biosynthesis